jgi:hypothetical protein
MGRDLILTRGYFQSNCGRWRTSGRPTTPNHVAAAQCGQRGGAMASAAEAHRSSALHGHVALFSVFSLPMELVVCGTHQGGLLPAAGSGAGHAVARFKPQSLAMVGERSKHRLTTSLGETGAAWNVEHQRRVDGARGASHAVWR